VAREMADPRKLQQQFKEYARAGQAAFCQALMEESVENRAILIERCSPDIISSVVVGMRLRYKEPTKDHIELFDYLLSIPEFKANIKQEDLKTALCIFHGTEIIRRLIEVSKEGIFHLTKSSLDTAQFLNKRPKNIPSAVKKEHILMIKTALDEQKERKKQEQLLLQAQQESLEESSESQHESGVKRKRTVPDEAEEEESKGEGEEGATAAVARAAGISGNFIHDMIKFGEEEGNIPFSNEAVGLKIYPSSNDDESNRHKRREYFTVTEFVKKRGRNSRLIAKKERKGKSSKEEILELDEETVMCDWLSETSPRQLTLWESYQEQEITEGVWSSRLTGDLQTEFNSLVDEFGKNEPVDYHPGTKDIVRDLIHPSLYPLVLSATKPKATGKKKYDETQKNFFNRPYEISRFQWLPSEVDVDQHGVARFVSPINNLDEAQYPQLYDCLGRILTHLVPGFEQVSQSLDPHPLSLAPPLP
jgi:hypothetical protein